MMFLQIQKSVFRNKNKRRFRVCLSYQKAIKRSLRKKVLKIYKVKQLKQIKTPKLKP